MYILTGKKPQKEKNWKIRKSRVYMMATKVYNIHKTEATRTKCNVYNTQRSASKVKQTWLSAGPKSLAEISACHVPGAQRLTAQSQGAQTIYLLWLQPYSHYWSKC